MEKEWEDFWVTGRVNDYLSYKNHYEVTNKEIGEQDLNGRSDYCDGNGDKHHANIGI